MVGPFDVLVRQDLLQCPHDKHFFRLVGTGGAIDVFFVVVVVAYHI